MSDIFKLFDGSMDAGGGASVIEQDGSSFSSIESENEVVGTLASGTDTVDLLVDYSDFANFVTFNSAESYVTLTADSIMNSYPVGGTVDDVQRFLNSLDGFQRFFLSRWPAWSGHLRLNPAVSSSYIRIDDVGSEGDSVRTSFLSPGTGSISIQGWIDVPVMTGSSDVQVVFQKNREGTGNGYTVYVSGSQLHFRVISGSIDSTVSASIPGNPAFFAAVLDRTGPTGTMSVFAGTTGSFPILFDSTQVGLGQRFDLASGSFFIGSGSVAGKVVRPFTGSLDSISAWSRPRTLADLTGSYNRKVYAQSGLLGSWQFNDASPSTPAAYSSVVRDRSGHRLDGRIQRFFSGSLGTGSFVNDVPDPILSLEDPGVVSYIVSEQVSGNLYDRNNQSLIFNLFPEAFTQGDQVSADVFSNFALALARHFDRIKLYVNQLPNLRRVQHSDFDQAPDELLEEVGRYFGWELQGNFATTDALRYFVGRNVRVGPDANASLSTRLSEIKSELWRRVLLNLSYLYKTKGTAESVEALLRTHGVDAGFVRLKEYARKTESTLSLEPVLAEKSAYTLAFMSGSTASAASPSVVVPGAAAYFSSSLSGLPLTVRYFTTGAIGNNYRFNTVATNTTTNAFGIVETPLSSTLFYVSGTTTLGDVYSLFPTDFLRLASSSINTSNVVPNLSGTNSILLFGYDSITDNLLSFGGDFSVEVRVRFPGTDPDVLVASEPSGAIVTLSSGTTAASYLSLWYERPDLSSATGNLYLTSSNGRLQLTSASIFDERFYNLSIVREHATGSIALRSIRYDGTELVHFTASVAASGATGYPIESGYSRVEVGSSTLVPSRGEFWGQEFRLWNSGLSQDELLAHSQNYESYGRAVSIGNSNLLAHWRMNDGFSVGATGRGTLIDSSPNHLDATLVRATPNQNPFTKFLFDYAYIPSIDYGWNQQKIRVFSGSRIDPQDAYHDERFVSLEFNMYDALNEDISHVITSYEELSSFIGLPVNRYREDYEGLRQMRETYFKRLQGPLNFRVFADMLEFFDSAFVRMVEKLLPARTSFKGDEMIVESHMLERPKYQYQLRPVHEGRIEISGSISIIDRGDDLD